VSAGLARMMVSEAFFGKFDAKSKGGSVLDCVSIGDSRE